jgi:hypothetical protein
MSEVLEVKSIKQICDECVKAKTFKSRKISAKDSTELDGAIDVISDVIDFVNAQPEEVEYILGKHVKDFVIPNLFVSRINPKSVRYNLANLRCIDLLDRPEYKGDCKYSYQKYIDAISIMNRYQKRDSLAEVTALESIRRDSTLADVINKASIKGKVRYDAEPFVPVKLNDSLSCLFKESYFNADDAEVITDYYINVSL